MGQKINPVAYRLATVATWNSKWFAPKRSFFRNLQEDTLARSFLKKKLQDSGLANVEIERTNQYVSITLYSSKPGLIIGRSGSGIQELMNDLKQKVFNQKSLNLKLNVKEVPVGGRLSAAITARQIAQDMEKRIPFRRSVKRALDQVMKAGALGAKIVVGGRLDGAEISRAEKFIQGKVPLATLRADIDYAPARAHTTYGTVGVKVWIYKGEVFEEKSEAGIRAPTGADDRRVPREMSEKKLKFKNKNSKGKVKTQNF